MAADKFVRTQEEVDEMNALKQGKFDAKKGRSGLDRSSWVDRPGDDHDSGLEDEGGAVPADLSHKIMALAREQQDELASEAHPQASAGGPLSSSATAQAAAAGRGGQISLASGGSWGVSGASDDYVYDGDDGALGDGVALAGDFVEVEEDEEGEGMVARFMTGDASTRRTLADIIMEKLEAMEAAKNAPGGVESGPASGGRAGAGASTSGIPPKVLEVYAEVGKFLQHYKSGRLPKVFKILPGMPNWEELLYLTRPESWSPHATAAATRIFASNLDSKRAQRFFFSILMPAVRDDIAEHKKLNYHLYMALKKALLKPDAFYKGLLLPLAAEGNCSLREARIVSSVLSKAKVPQPHSAAAMLKLARMRYSGAQSVMIKALVDKKYALPYIVIDDVVNHFAQFGQVEPPLPVIWHQGLLSFAQRYKADVTRAQKETLKRLMKLHTHPAITAEIRRELFSAPCRGEATIAGAGASAKVGSGYISSAVAPVRRRDGDGDVTL